MNKGIVKLSLVVFFVCSIVFSVQSQELETEAEKIEIYTDSVSADSVRSFASRTEIVLPDSIDLDSIELLLGPMLLKKLKLENDVVVLDAEKEDFTNLEIPDIVYYYFLQRISDYNLENKVYKKSSEYIQKDFKKILLRIKRNNLKHKRNELLNNNIENLNYIEEKENTKDLTSKEVGSLIFAYDLVSDKLKLVDGKLTVNISENKKMDILSKKCVQYLQFMIELINLDFEINDSSLEDREMMKEWLKKEMKRRSKKYRNYEKRK